MHSTAVYPVLSAGPTMRAGALASLQHIDNTASRSHIRSQCPQSMFRRRVWQGKEELYRLLHAA